MDWTGLVWTNQNSVVPIDEDTAFVVGHNIHYDEDDDDDDLQYEDEDADPDTAETNKFRLFMSTKRLLAGANNCDDSSQVRQASTCS